jgi:ABC-type nitrate/sulfonate/bicarbonate transport system permease component
MSMSAPGSLVGRTVDKRRSSGWHRTARHIYHQAPVASAFVISLSVWAILSSTGALSPDVLPSPRTVWATGIDTIVHPYGTTTLMGQAWISIVRVLAGFGLATVLGVLAGVCMALVPTVRYFLEPILSFQRPVPAFTLITVLIIWFGIGELPKIMLVFLAVFPAMTVYTSAAMAAMPSELADAARSLGASRRQIFIHVRMITALPEIISGMRVLLALAWTAVMGAELIAADSGLGWMIWRGMRYLRTDVIFVGVFTIGVIGALMDLVLALAWRRVGNWAPRVRGA